MKNTKIRKKRISPKRLSKILAERQQKTIYRHLQELYSCLTPKQRKEIKDMFIKNSKLE